MPELDPRTPLDDDELEEFDALPFEDEGNEDVGDTSD